MGEADPYLTIYKSDCDECYKSGLKNTVGGERRKVEALMSLLMDNSLLVGFGGRGEE